MLLTLKEKKKATKQQHRTPTKTPKQANSGVYFPISTCSNLKQSNNHSFAVSHYSLLTILSSDAW